jgi:hypothetical protein
LGGFRRKTNKSLTTIFRRAANDAVFSVLPRICYNNKMFCSDYKYRTRSFLSKPKRSKVRQPGECAFKGEMHKLALSAVTLTKVSAMRFVADHPPSSTELVRRAAETDPEVTSLLSVHPRNADGAILLVHRLGDKMLMRQISCDSVFHGVPHRIAAAHRTKAECLGTVPDQVQRGLIPVGNSIFLAQRVMTFEAGAAEIALGRYFLRFWDGKTSDVIALVVGQMRGNFKKVRNF